MISISIKDLCMEYHPPAAAAHKSLHFQLYSLSALYIWIVGFSRFVGSRCMQATEWAGSVAGVAGIQGRSKRLTYAGVVMSTIYKPPLLIPRFLSFSFFFLFGYTIQVLPLLSPPQTPPTHHYHHHRYHLPTTTYDLARAMGVTSQTRLRRPPDTTRSLSLSHNKSLQ